MLLYFDVSGGHKEHSRVYAFSCQCVLFICWICKMSVFFRQPLVLEPDYISWYNLNDLIWKIWIILAFICNFYWSGFFSWIELSNSIRFFIFRKNVLSASSERILAWELPLGDCVQDIEATDNAINSITINDHGVIAAGGEYCSTVTILMVTDLVFKIFNDLSLYFRFKWKRKSLGLWFWFSISTNHPVTCLWVVRTPNHSVCFAVR